MDQDLGYYVNATSLHGQRRHASLQNWDLKFWTLGIATSPHAGDIPPHFRLEFGFSASGQLIQVQVISIWHWRLESLLHTFIRLDPIRMSWSVHTSHFGLITVL
jgi:hypothetical protein